MLMIIQLIIKNIGFVIFTFSDLSIKIL